MDAALTDSWFMHGRSGMFGVVVAACLLVVPQAGASVPMGTITAQTGWSKLAQLAPHVTVSRKQVTVAGYSGPRTLTRVSWTLGNSHVRLDASPVVASSYGAGQHSFREGRISAYVPSFPAIAGINGDTFCQGCANNGGDLLHGLMVRNRRIYATGGGPEVGYLKAGRMMMGTVHAVPVRLALPGLSASIAVWNALSIPGRTMQTDQVAVFSKRGASVVVPSGSTALTLTGKITVDGGATTVGGAFRRMLEMAVPYQDTSDKVTGPAGASEWVDAYRISQTGGTPQSLPMPVKGPVTSGGTVVVPRNGVVLVAPTASSAGTALQAAAAKPAVQVALDDRGWTRAASMMDGKHQMVVNGVAQTRYPGWPDSWPWYCQGPGRGCVRAAVGESSTRGWLIMETAANGNGLTMPDFSRVLAQLGATNAMAFDSNTHADFWRKGASPITAGSGEPGAPTTTALRYH
jgi:hypothetical protein